MPRNEADEVVTNRQTNPNLYIYKKNGSENPSRLNLLFKKMLFNCCTDCVVDGQMKLLNFEGFILVYYD